MYKYVLIDLDDTLLDFKKSEEEALFQSLTKIGLEVTEDHIRRFGEINEQCFQEFEQGIIPLRINFQKKRFDVFFKEFEVEADSLFVNDLYLTTLEETNYLIDGALELLGYLSHKYKLYAVSNGVKEVQVKRMKKSGILKFFDDVYVSSEIGFNKPDLMFFNSVFARVGDPNICAYIIVGDREKNDVIGGLKAGIDTCLYNPNEEAYEVKPNYEIKNLVDLIEIL